MIPTATGWTLPMLRPGSRGLTTLLAMLTGLGPLSMDMYLPSLPAIARVLEAPTARVQLTIASYLIGFAAGQVIYGPISDRRGRRPVLLAALALYATGTLVCAATQSIDTLIAARFLQAVGGSGAIVLARAVVRDLYSGARAGRELSLMGAISGFAPIAAPMIGGVLQTAFGWRASFIVMAAAAVVAIVVVGRLLPETLRRRTDEPISLSFMAQSYAAVLRQGDFLAYLGILTISYAGLFAWISGASVILQRVYGLSAFAFGFTFALGAAGYVLGTTIASRLVLRLGLDRTIGLGVTLLAAGGLAVAAVVAADIANAVWLVVAMAIYLAGLGLAMPQAIAGALTPFPERAGTASSLMGFTQQTVAAIVTAAVGDYLGPSAWPVAGVVVAMGCLSFIIWALTRRLRSHGPLSSS
jgi:DHA1 family bicyclomycin/chloramphenicol resistance-like MFS transporter